MFAELEAFVGEHRRRGANQSDIGPIEWGEQRRITSVRRSGWRFRFRSVRQRARLAHLLIGAVLSLSLASGGCAQTLMRFPESSGVRQAKVVDPHSVDGLGPWTKDDDVGMVPVVRALDLRTYDTLVVEVFPVSDLVADEDRRLSADVQRALQDKLIFYLRRTRLFARVVDNRSGTTLPEAKLLRMQGEITRFDVGSRALRWLAGF